MPVIDEVAEGVAVLGLFSDRAGPVAFYANCRELEVSGRDGPTPQSAVRSPKPWPQAPSLLLPKPCLTS